MIDSRRQPQLANDFRFYYCCCCCGWILSSVAAWRNVTSSRSSRDFFHCNVVIKSRCFKSPYCLPTITLQVYFFYEFPILWCCISPFITAYECDIPQPLGKFLSFLEATIANEGMGRPRGFRRFKKHIWKIFYRGDPKIGTPGTPRGSYGSWNQFFEKISLKELFGFI